MLQLPETGVTGVSVVGEWFTILRTDSSVSSMSMALPSRISNCLAGFKFEVRRRPNTSLNRTAARVTAGADGPRPATLRTGRATSLRARSVRSARYR